MDAGQLSESFKYDKHGNIKEVTRFGEDDVIDLLTLSYHGNQLKKVTDGWGSGNLYNQKEYQDKANETEEFAYDANGNMVKDLDRNIVTVRYNMLNLPDTVQFKNGNQIISSYDASGRKLSTRNFTLATPVVVPIGETRKWEYDLDVIDETGTFYVDNIEYDFNGCDPGVYMLGKVFNPEGYATRINSTSLLPDYHYYRKDHLGNNREVWRAAYKDYRGTIVPATAVQCIQYYPSGLPWAEGTGRDVQNRKYNGKEFIEMHGYDTYDYVARGMYPAIMRFMTPDPLAEKHYNYSSYTYCLNNPIKYIDPLGLDTIPIKNVNWNNFNTSQDVITLEEVTIIPQKASFFYWIFFDSNLGKNTINYSSNIGATYAGYRYTADTPWREGFYRTQTGKLHNLSELKKRPNGKYKQGVAGIRKGAQTAEKSVRLLTRITNYIGSISAIYSIGQFINNPNLDNTIDVTSNIGSYLYWEVGAFSTALDLMIQASSGEREQIRKNITNGVTPTNNVYNPTLGTYDFSPF